MRLPIAQQIALLIATCVILAVTAVGGAALWNLRIGFGDYLRLRDEEHLTRLSAALEKRAAMDPDMRWLRGNRQALRELQDDALGLEPPPRQRPPPPGVPDPDPAGPPPPRPGGLQGRLVILDASGAVVAGRPLPVGQPRSTRTLRIQGQVAGSIELAAEPRPEGLDALFLQRQTRGMAYAAAGAITLALLLGWWFAQRWGRPLRELQLATRRIAKGDLSTEVGDTKTPLRSSAREIDMLISDVNAMAAALAALELTRRTWIAQISHELRTPLAVLRGELEAIEDGARQPTIDMMRNLRDEVMQLTRLVNDLHLLSVADLGKLPCEFAWADADEALRSWGSKFAPRAHALGLKLDVQPARHEPMQVYWDMGRMEQLVANLLENSLRYTQSPGHIRMQWQVSARTVSITVEDSPPGVAQHLQRQLFDPLFRVDAARTRTGQHGSGLGLSIVRAIARAHRGSVVAQTSSLGGLRIDVELPVDPSAWDRRKG